MRFALCVLALVLPAASCQTSPVRLSPGESRNFPSECSLNSTLTAAYDRQSTSIQCTFTFQDVPPPGLQYLQTATSGSGMVDSTFDCPGDGIICFAETRVEDFSFVNCSLGFTNFDNDYMSCFNYSFFVGETPQMDKPLSPKKERDVHWLIGLFITLAIGAVVWAITVGVLCQVIMSLRKYMNMKLEHDLGHMRKHFEARLARVEQQVAQQQAATGSQSSPLTSSGVNPASAPLKLSETGSAEQATTVSGGSQTAFPSHLYSNSEQGPGYFNPLGRQNEASLPAADDTDSIPSSYDNKTKPFNAGVTPQQ